MACRVCLWVRCKWITCVHMFCSSATDEKIVMCNYCYYITNIYKYSEIGIIPSISIQKVWWLESDIMV